MMQSLFSKDMMKKVFCQGYLWLLLLLLYSPIFIIIIFSFTEAKVMGNWTGFSLQLIRLVAIAQLPHILFGNVGKLLVCQHVFRVRVYGNMKYRLLGG